MGATLPQGRNFRQQDEGSMVSSSCSFRVVYTLWIDMNPNSHTFLHFNPNDAVALALMIGIKAMAAFVIS
jgi:hypothetical protein